MQSLKSVAMSRKKERSQVNAVELDLCLAENLNTFNYRQTIARLEKNKTLAPLFIRFPSTVIGVEVNTLDRL